ncbi:uncharacterized protein TNCV_3404261 [Trichonephila clavipes]|nr:uncharacterized protein TNCV_3404261 [Trichonephila clavipes]
MCKHIKFHDLTYIPGLKPFKFQPKKTVIKYIEYKVAVGSLVVRASDSRPEGLGSMPPNTLRVHTENLLVKSVDPKFLWAESRVQGTGEYFSPIQFHGKIVEIGDGAIYHPFGEFLRAKSYCHLLRPTTVVLLAPCHDEFRGPRSDYVRQVALATTTK